MSNIIPLWIGSMFLSLRFPLFFHPLCQPSAAIGI